MRMESQLVHDRRDPTAWAAMSFHPWESITGAVLVPAPGELLTQVSFQAPKRAAYMKFKNPASRFALVGVFVADFGNGKVRVTTPARVAENG